LRSLPRIGPESSHDELFIERYQRLLAWSLKLTDNNRELAEDLVQDAFVQFTFARPDLSAIQNVDAYLYGILRHLHLSQVRRATRSRLQPLSIVEYESAELGLRSVDPRAQIQVQDELRRVCNYVCLRKESSRAASVLILRFFLGYYPSEIVRILRTSRSAIRERLRNARAEVRLGIENPKALGFVGNTPIVESLPTSFARTSTDFLMELRHLIFRSRPGDCFSPDQLHALYRSPGETAAEGIDTSTLAHMVACPECLDAVNRLHGLPSLAERYPTDSLDKEKRRKDGPGGGATGGGSMKESIEECRRRARETFEHEPQELCVAVNGYLQGTQRIGSELSELTLNVKDEEKISFVEIFSEQDIRLLFMNVDEAPPEGPGEQHLSVALSDTRQLDLTVRFRSPWPTLHVSYHDPAFRVEPAGVSADAMPAEPVQTEASVGKNEAELKPKLRRWIESISGTRYLGFLLRPGTVTAAFALLLIAVILFLQFRTAPPKAVTATGLLNQSAAADEAIAARIDTVLHRLVSLEARTSTGELIASRKIEVWQSAEKGIIARRLYDEKSALIAGDWRRADGVQTIYHHGSRPRLQLSTPPSATYSLDEVWQLSVSAKDFRSLIGNAESLQLDERSADYVLRYAGDSKNSRGLVSASLVLSRTDLHATEMTLVVRAASSDPQSADSTVSYHFVETSFERRAPKTVAPAVFEPEQILLERGVSSSSTDKSLILPTSPSTAPAVVATRELEVELLSLLNRVGADLGEQVSVSRTPEGALLVQAIVDSERRKSELQTALAGVRNNPAVRIDIETRAEAVSRQQRSGSQPGTVTIHEAAPAGNSVPVDADLRRYFSATGLSGEQLEINVNRFSNRTLNRSLQIMQHAWALRRLAGRFSPEELETLEAAARGRWLGMLRGHAQSLHQQTNLLERELGPVFPGMMSGAASAVSEIKGDRELVQAIERLFALCSANDHAISAAFTISADNSRGAGIRSQNFWRSLKSIESLAGAIGRVQ
jgi:RNA polymerase sigma factor (sigma-70 family)